MGKKSKIPSPCIDVCKFRRQGHCIGCSMTRTQKKLYKSLRKPEHREAFVELLRNQQAVMGSFDHWPRAYARKCAKKAGQPTVKLLKQTG